jgi:hypothetical protein
VITFDSCLVIFITSIGRSSVRSGSGLLRFFTLERDILLSLLRLFHRKADRTVRIIRSMQLATEQAMTQGSVPGPDVIGPTVGSEVVDESGAGAMTLVPLYVGDDEAVAEVWAGEPSTNCKSRTLRPTNSDGKWDNERPRESDRVLFAPLPCKIVSPVWRK